MYLNVRSKSSQILSTVVQRTGCSPAGMLHSGGLSSSPFVVLDSDTCLENDPIAVHMVKRAELLPDTDPFETEEPHRVLPAPVDLHGGGASSVSDTRVTSLGCTLSPHSAAESASAELYSGVLHRIRGRGGSLAPRASGLRVRGCHCTYGESLLHRASVLLRLPAFRFLAGFLPLCHSLCHHHNGKLALVITYLHLLESCRKISIHGGGDYLKNLVEAVSTSVDFLPSTEVTGIALSAMSPQSARM